MFLPSDPAPAANFLDVSEDQRARRQTYIVGGLFAIGVALLSALGAYASYRSVKHGTTVFAEVAQAPVIIDIRRLVFGADAAVDPQKAPRERLNILLLGIGGEGHDGGQLTDTIILASVDLKTKRVALLSIPRDTAYPLGGGRFEKINAVQAYAEQEHPGQGARQTADALGRLLEIEIDHVVRLDFKGFAQFVDAIGGIDVDVERSFVDPQYPTADDKWTTVSFKKGPQHFSGEQALTFARSRHGNNGEGSDFARSHRQQMIMLAIREKLLSLKTLADPTKLSALYSVISTHVQADLTLWDALQLAPLAEDFSRDRVSMRVLTDAPDGELVAANVNGAFMLFPRKPDWSDIREIVQNPFTEIAIAPTSTAGVVNTKPVPTESINLEVKNGTARTGFASQVAAKLERSGYEIVAFGNALRRGYERTVIYDLTNGQKSVQLSALRQLLQADVSVISPSPDPLDAKRSRLILNDGIAPERLANTNIDFVIILGEASYAFVNSPSYASSSSSARNRPIVALVGRTNVGKSSLWNRLTEMGHALVSATPHTTRDRRYGTVLWRGVVFDVVDTGGMDTESDLIGEGIRIQAEHAIKEADLILFVVDGEAGVLPQDQELAQFVRRTSKKPAWLLVNKIDQIKKRSLAHQPDFYQLALGEPRPVSANTGFLIGDLLDDILTELERLNRPAIPAIEAMPLRLAIVGRPNVGKSSLVNSILGEERVIVSPIPHTTREPQDTWIRYQDRDVVLVDTAGMRKQSRIDNAVEEAGIERNLLSLKDCDVACLVFDVTQDPTTQDRHLAGVLEETSKGLILVANKWDLIPNKKPETTQELEALIRQLFPFLSWAPMIFVSAKEHQRTRHLLDLAFEIQNERHRKIDYNAINRLLKACIKAKKPIAAYGPKSPRIYDVAQIGEAPPTFLVTILGEKESVHNNWIRFFEKRLREKFGFKGTPIIVKARNVPMSKSGRKRNVHGPGYEAVAGKINEPKPLVNQTRRRQKR